MGAASTPLSLSSPTHLGPKPLQADRILGFKYPLQPERILDFSTLSYEDVVSGPKMGDKGLKGPLKGSPDVACQSKEMTMWHVSFP